MTGLDSTKISAAILTAGILAVGSGVVVDLLTHREKIAEHAFPVAATTTAAGPAGAAEKPGLEPVLPLLASADGDAGQKVARKCKACHTFEEGGANKIGPNLWNVVGRDIAADASFGYSPSLQEKSGEAWSYQNLNAFIGKPKDWAPGTKMTFAGVKKAQDRANLIGYLRSLSGSPAALPTPEEIGEQKDAAASETGEAMTAAAEATGDAAEPATEAASETMQAAAGTGGLGDLIAAASGEAGQKVARKCKACHSFEKGGPNKIGPTLWGVLGRNFASHEGFKYSNAISERSGETWSFEALDSYLTKPKDYLPGTKMAFPGIKKPADRAALLVYLRKLSDAPLDLPQ